MIGINKLVLSVVLSSVSLLTFAIIGDGAAASGITYTQNPVTYPVGKMITNDKASCAGTLSNVSISPALPDGLVLITTSGTIYGTPTQIVNSTVYTLSGTCSGAQVTGALTLGIGDAPTAYYVDDLNGNDANDGHTQATAWKSLTKVNNATLGPNTSVRFRRGGVWRGQLFIQSGSSAGGLYYDAYGTGPAPVLMGSVSASNPAGWTPNFIKGWAPSGTGGWTNVSGNIWKSNMTFAPLPGYGNGMPYNSANDVGNIIYNPTPTTVATGVEAMTGLPGAQGRSLTQSTSYLTSPGMWLFNTTDWKVYIYSTSNPATAFPNLELAINTNVVNALNGSANYVYLQNFTIKNGAGGGVYTAFNGSHVTLRDLQISYIGGGNLGGSGTRYGDAITFFSNADNDLVERVMTWQIYDGGPNNQSTANNTVVNNIIYRNNIVWNAITPSFMFFNGTASTVSNIYVENNTFVGTDTWSVNQRTNGNQQFGLYLPLGGNPAVSNIVYKNNIFYSFKGCGIVMSTFTQWKGSMTMDYDDWLGSGGLSLTSFCSNASLMTISSWAPTYPAEQHGIELNPSFVNLSTGDFHLATGSPLINAGTNLYKAGVVLDYDRNPRPTTGAFDIGAFQHH